MNIGDTKISIVGGVEISFRKISNSHNFTSLKIDTLSSNEIRSLNSDQMMRIGPKPAAKESFYVSNTFITNRYLNSGLRIENSSEKVYLIFQPQAAIDFGTGVVELPGRHRIDKMKFADRLTFNGRTSLVYKPLNLSMLIDLKLGRYSFTNVSIGLPIDIGGVFGVKKGGG